MMEAYRSGDPYLAFAKQAGAAPPDATKATHKAVRDQFKSTVLAVQYGMGEDALAQRIGQPPIRARELLRLHRETYRVFWRWSDAAVDHAMLERQPATVFGWRVQVPAANANPRSLRNFPMQANGAEMLRLACCLATERGIEVCAPVHDAVLICAPLECLDADVARMQDAMREASRMVLDGFELGTDAKMVRYPDRYADPRGAVMWDRVMKLIHQQQPRQKMRRPSHPSAGGSVRKCGCLRTKMRIRQVSSMSNNNSSRPVGTQAASKSSAMSRPQQAARKGRQVSSVRGKFIAGPVDIIWLSQARKLGVTALWVGLGLWFLRGLRRSDSFIVSNLIMQEWNVQPDAKRRALRKLENAGLITIERKGKRNPRVTLVVQTNVLLAQ